MPFFCVWPLNRALCHFGTFWVSPQLRHDKRDAGTPRPEGVTKSRLVVAQFDVRLDGRTPGVGTVSRLRPLRLSCPGLREGKIMAAGVLLTVRVLRRKDSPPLLGSAYSFYEVVHLSGSARKRLCTNSYMSEMQTTEAPHRLKSANQPQRSSSKQPSNGLVKFNSYLF